MKGWVMVGWMVRVVCSAFVEIRVVGHGDISTYLRCHIKCLYVANCRDRHMFLIVALAELVGGSSGVAMWQREEVN